MSYLPWEAFHRLVREADPIKRHGKVSRVVGLTVESLGPPCSIGDLCQIVHSRVRRPVLAEVVGFREEHVLLMPLGEMAGIRAGSPVRATGRRLTVPVGSELLGRVMDALGRPLDGKGPLITSRRRPLVQPPPSPLDRPRIRQPLPTGVRALDAFTTWGRGQRLGLFSGSGIGKSILLGMIARNSSARANVIAMVGERGREVKEFVERDLGPEGLKRSVVVVATSDQPALVRVKCALAATTVAEEFRDQGWDVILMMDSLTRVALAQREIGLAAGEPPTTRGYTPSVFALLPALLERGGTAARGTISGLYTVLVEGDDLTEPVADSVRSILDGHVVLSRRLANRGHYPPVEILESLSRVMVDVVSPEHRRAARVLTELLATYREAEDLIQIGAYRRGTSRTIDAAIDMREPLERFLQQDMAETSEFTQTLVELGALAERAGALLEKKEGVGDEAVPVPAAQA
jgi:flagellum-specific ATP synthase